MVSVLVVDDNPVVRSGLKAVLLADGRFTIAGEAGSARAAVAAAEDAQPDAILLDVRMPELDGVAVLAQLSELAAVVMMTAVDDPAVVREAFRLGARGYLVHGRFTAHEIAHALVAVHAGQSYVSPAVTDPLLDIVRAGPVHQAAADVRGALTQRESQILDLAVRGLTDDEIADRLVISQRTVKNHVTRTYRKLGVHTRAGAIAAWLGVPDPGAA